jgi:DNA-binding protein YbaB
MLDQIKNSPKYLKLWKSQNKLKKQMENIFSQHENDHMSVLIRGDKRIEKITIDGDDQKELKDFLNEAFKKLEKKLEKEMQSSASDLMEMLK